MTPESTSSYRTRPARDTGHQPGRSKALILAAATIGQFMIQMDLTIVNVALPDIGRTLHGSTAGLQWVIDGYSLALASLLLTGGRIGDRSGHKRVYLAGLGIFGVGSALCALAHSMAALICFRVLQGIGAAAEMPATLAILSHTFTGQRERAQAVGIWAGAAGTSLAAGPLLGGWLTDAFGWPAVFLVNLPVTAIVVVLTLVTVTEAAAVLGAVPRERAGMASSTNLTARLAGGVFGVAVLGALLPVARTGGRHAFTGTFVSGLHAALAVAGVIALAGAAAATAFIRPARTNHDRAQ